MNKGIGEPIEEIPRILEFLNESSMLSFTIAMMSFNFLLSEIVLRYKSLMD